MTTVVAPEAVEPVAYDDVPIVLNRSSTGADKAFKALLATSSAIVLIILAAVVTFLAVNGWSALVKAGVGLVTDKTWAPNLGQFDLLPLLVGTVLIAVVAMVIAVPVSLATALMINEYAPHRLRPFLTGMVDMLATVPSIIYGFWGFKLISNLQAPPAEWLVDHFSFVPFFRTPTPEDFTYSVFACGLVAAVTLIPIITSVSREVMAQVPRDTCEAAIGMGGTRWGMLSDVVLPLSKNGIVGGSLLGFGRGLGETMIVVLILSPGYHLTPAIMGPGGLGSIPYEITQNFVTGSPITKSALILAGLALFVTTLAVNLTARFVVDRSSRKMA